MKISIMLHGRRALRSRSNRSMVLCGGRLSFASDMTPIVADSSKTGVSTVVTSTNAATRLRTIRVQRECCADQGCLRLISGGFDRHQRK